MVEITPKVVKRYQADRLSEKAGPKTINDEVQLLLRLCGEQGVLIRATLHRDKALKLPLPASPGRPYSAEEKARMLEEAAKLRTPQMHAALALDLNTGLRDKELREIRWEQIDLVHKKALTVGKSKTEAGTGHVIPLNDTAIAAMEAKRRALDEIAARQRAADEKRKDEAERQQQAAVVSQSAVVQ